MNKRANLCNEGIDFGAKRFYDHDLFCIIKNLRQIIDEKQPMLYLLS